jgi:hypothetical protein
MDLGPVWHRSWSVRLLGAQTGHHIPGSSSLDQRVQITASGDNARRVSSSDATPTRSALKHERECHQPKFCTGR